MTRRSNARLAGIAFLVYIAAALTGMVLSGRATAGETPAAKLASLATHESPYRIGILLELVGCFCALVLAATLYAITREEDADLALLALTCRVAEGVIGGVSLQGAARTLWLATTKGAKALDPATRDALRAYYFGGPHFGGTMGATFFALGSTLFAWLLLRGRMIPAWLAWVGFLGSLLVLVILPLQLVGSAAGLVTDVMWLPLLVFELTFAVWLIAKGAAMPASRRALGT